MEVGVHIDRIERRTLISELINTAGVEQKVTPDLSDDLLNELTDLVESPSVIKGHFDADYLELPAEVLSTVMRVHQRYVPLYLENASHDCLSLNAKKELLPKFLCISNGLYSASDSIRIGNERVLRARLADAEFFINSDLSISSMDRTKELANVTFAEGLGTLLDRVERIRWIASLLNKQLNYLRIDHKMVLRASYLCKHDLVTQIVGEFPELQGIMGGKYLLAEGESREVSLAVMEHYMPKRAGGELPKSEIGALLSLADKIELLLSIFAIGQRPTGSSDPYALRRAGNGILQILLDKGWKLDLINLLNESIDFWISLFPDIKIQKKRILDELSELFRQRFVSHLQDSGFDIDLVQSVAGETVAITRLLSDPGDALFRANLLQKMRNSGQLLEVQAVVVRASRLAQKLSFDSCLLNPSGVVDPGLFEKDCERNMLNILIKLEPIVNSKVLERYTLLAEGLAAGSEALSEFFDGDTSVMVMTDIKNIRINRLKLLAILCNQANVLADFNQINN